MSFILKLFIILHFRIGYLFLYAYELVSILLTKVKSTLMNLMDRINSEVLVVNCLPVSLIPYDRKFLKALEYLFENLCITSQRRKYAFALETLSGVRMSLFVR
ncbi:LOW QUALITY PROTEIN: hypothetical protein Smp_196830 [Schistosoma mansoni]|uniref:hypothetical protein n=1 Tax=Schistosoma mansoni TaxID=6183 RepID=UPI00022DC1DA|nr:LOW QUALITY PROTEIN: hypothetical protein Smp_196830 [Schistosoma mansoni]|eukprot:XP_018648229.1 LOW QUALITY PROTEIN: hypothetical protein Smp_196830 [Schistosoma mansoni]